MFTKTIVTLISAMSISAYADGLSDFSNLSRYEQTLFLNSRYAEFEKLQPEAFFGANSRQAQEAREQQARESDMMNVIWGDTILEGYYGTYGDFSSRLAVMVKDNEAYAYELTVTQAAVSMTGDLCEYQRDTKTYVGRDCVYGTISETMFFSTGFEPIGRPSFGPAKFETAR